MSTLCVDSRNDLSFSSVLEVSFIYVQQAGVPLSLNDPFRRRFSENRPFEGGFEATLGIFVVIYCHM